MMKERITMKKGKFETPEHANMAAIQDLIIEYVWQVTLFRGEPDTLFTELLGYDFEN